MTENAMNHYERRVSTVGTALFFAGTIAVLSARGHAEVAIAVLGVVTILTTLALFAAKRYADTAAKRKHGPMESEHTPSRGES